MDVILYLNFNIAGLYEERKRKESVRGEKLLRFTRIRRLKLPDNRGMTKARAAMFNYFAIGVNNYFS